MGEYFVVVRGQDDVTWVPFQSRGKALDFARIQSRACGDRARIFLVEPVPKDQQGWLFVAGAMFGIFLGLALAGLLRG